MGLLVILLTESIKHFKILKALLFILFLHISFLISIAFITIEFCRETFVYFCINYRICWINRFKLLPTKILLSLSNFSGYRLYNSFLKQKIFHLLFSINSRLNLKEWHLFREIYYFCYLMQKKLVTYIT